MKMLLFFSRVMASPTLASFALAVLTLLLATAYRSRNTFPPGGYPYPDHLVDGDTTFFLYPLKNTLSRRDSFNDIWDGYAFGSLDEPNLSLRPLGTTEFRLFQPGYRSYDDLVILLTPTTFTIKRQSAMHHRYSTDTNRLSSLERRLIKFMGRHFDEPRPDSAKRHRYWRIVDSMEALYPQLKDPAFYVYTIRKETIKDSAFRHCRTFTEAITSSQYRSFVDSLNASGYWHLPYKRECHEGITNDGPSYFSLEANTPNQYNFVSGYPCPNDTNSFYKACDQLVRLAGLQKEINILWIDQPADTAHQYPPVFIQDVHLEDVKEQPPLPKPHYPKKPKRK
jgi:hypothetical protein